MRRVAGHMLCRGGGIRALVGMDHRHTVDVGLRRMLHAIMVRDDAGRRIQRGHAARHITERRTTPCGTEPCRLAFAIAEHAAIRCDANHDGHRTMGVDHSRSGDLGPLP